MIRSQASRLDLVALTVQLMLVEVLDGNGTERVESDVQSHTFDIQAGEHLLGEVQTCRRRGCRARLARVHGLVTRRVGERLGDVRRQRRLSGRLAVQAKPPPSFAEVLEQLDRPVAATGSQPPARSGQAFPETVVVQPFQQQNLSLRSLDRNPCRHDARVVDDDERVADHVR